MSNSEQIQHMNRPHHPCNVWRSQKLHGYRLGSEENIPLENFYHQSLSSNQISTTYLISEKINKNLSGSSLNQSVSVIQTVLTLVKMIRIQPARITKNKI